MPATVERTYQLTKVRPGDWLLPSNDAKQIWRVCRYRDGADYGLADVKGNWDVWAVWRWTDPVTINGFVDVEDWSRWESVSDGYKTRRDAIAAALELPTEPDSWGRS